MPQLHHLHGSPVPASNLLGQVLPEDGHFFTRRRADMRREKRIFRPAALAAVRSKQEQVGKLACGQPREPARVAHPPEGQAPVTVEPVPPQLRGLELLSGHGLYGIPEDGFHLSDC